MRALFLSLLLVFSLLFPACRQTPPVVETKSGPVRGAIEKGVEVYRGIPYAEPPTGELRWKPPKALRPWTNVRMATIFGSPCPQRAVSEIEGGGDLGEISEDCLYLNIWVPAKRAKQPLPVMVWIHGGAFMVGAGSSAEYAGLELARKGVVVVTINYRLGPFGFFVHPALSRESPRGVSGNYGLMDQAEALRWIQKNIRAFGGDPERVTIFGESAGALSVGYLLLAPQAKGLFHGAILQSGAPTSQPYIMPTATGSLRQALETGRGFAAKLGCNRTRDAAGAMRKKTMEEVLSAAQTPTDFIFKRTGFVFAPVLDGHFLPGNPGRMLAEGKQHDVPVIVGSNSDEATLFIRDLSADEYKKWISKIFGQDAGTVLAMFPAGTRENLLTSANRFLTVLWFTEPARFMAKSMSHKQSKVYLYEFTHVPENSLLEDFGAFHGQEIEYVFGNLSSILATKKDKALSKTMMDYWVNFAATGDPNGGHSLRWPAYDGQSDQNIEFREGVAVRSNLKKETCDFVEKIRRKHGYE